ncbi:MAG: nuclear transport factor 2 family protein [Bdellovibrionales bacterium]
MAVASKKSVKGKKPEPKVTKKAAPKAKAATKGATKPPAKVTKTVKKETKPASVPKTKAPASLARMPRPAPVTQMLAQNGSTPPALPPAVQAFVDKNEITDILYRLARGIDRIDETLLRSAFHHEATLDFGPGVFQGTSNDYIHWVIGVMNQIRESHHMITNILPTLEGDVALVESYCHAHYRLDKPTGREDVFIGSRYLDRFERRPTGAAGVWKIMHRKQIIDWVRTEAVSDLFYHQNPDALWSYRTKTDPSYQMDQFPGSQPGVKMPAFLGRRYESKSVKF